MFLSLSILWHGCLPVICFHSSLRRSPSLYSRLFAFYFNAGDLIQSHVHCHARTARKIVQLTAGDREGVGILNEIFFAARHYDLKPHERLLPSQVSNRIDRCFFLRQASPHIKSPSSSSA